jgi:hypothetical protein
MGKTRSARGASAVALVVALGCASQPPRPAARHPDTGLTLVGPGACPAGNEAPSSVVRTKVYRRRYEVFPPVALSYWISRATSMLAELEICVDVQGRVCSASFQQPFENPDVNRLVGAAILSWRYEPLVREGAPAPFCHPARIEYTRKIRM